MWTKSSYELYLTANSMPKILVITLCHEKTRKMKKAFCFDMCPCHSLWKNLSSSDFRFSQVTSVEKGKPRKHFSASACGLSLKNLFLGSPFSTSVTWEKRKSDEDKFFLRVAQTNIETKYYCHPRRSQGGKTF